MLLTSIVMILMTIWGALAIYYSVASGEEIRDLLALSFVVFGVVILGWYIFSGKRIRSLGVFMVGFLMLLVAGPPFARSPIRVDPRMSHDARRSVYGAWPWAANFFQASAKALELAGHYQRQTHCLRSGEFVA